MVGWLDLAAAGRDGGRSARMNGRTDADGRTDDSVRLSAGGRAGGRNSILSLIGRSARWSGGEVVAGRWAVISNNQNGLRTNERTNEARLG